MIRPNVGVVLTAAAVMILLLVAFVLALAQDKLPELALDLTVYLFATVLAVFVIERALVWQEKRRWVPAKEWMYVIMLEGINDLLKELLPVAVPKEEDAGEITVYEVTGQRVHFGEVAAYGLLRLLVNPADKEMQSHVLWYAKELEPLRYVEMTKKALSETREQIRETFASATQSLEADITAMLMNFEQAIVVAIRHLDSAIAMREEKLEDVPYLHDEQSAEQRIREADQQLAFTTSIVIESVVSSAMKPKAWLEDQLHGREKDLPFQHLPASNGPGTESTERD
jgi:hypothetical protein